MTAAIASSTTRDLPRRIGFVGAAAVMIGIIIGSGIFKSPTTIAQQIDRPGLILALWSAGGVLALLGAWTYAELTTRFPRSGGLYVFLKEGFGRAGAPLAFTFGWTYMLITKPFAAAGIMVPGVEHIMRLAGYPEPVPELPKLILTSILLVGFTAVNVPGVKLGTGLATVLTAIKFGALAAIVVVALVLMKGSAANFGGPVEGAAKAVGIGAIGAAMSTILWAFDGWSDVGSIAGEVERPRRTLPRVLMVGVLATTALYLAVNAVFIWMVPLPEMARAETIGPMVAGRLMGGEHGAAAVVVTVLIIISTLGSSHASIITGARVTFAQARDGLLFKSLGKIHEKYQTPAVALWVQCVLSLVVLWVLRGSFQRLADGFVFTMWIFYGLAGVALLLIRRREGDSSDEQAFRCPGYPVVPLLFVASALAMSVSQVVHDPWYTLPWLGVLAAGWPVYGVWRRRVGVGSEG